MRKILRNEPTPQKTNPDLLENTRDPQEYKPATVKSYNDRYKNLWTIDPAKAKVMSVHQNTFKPWLATVALGEDIYGADGKFIATRQQSTTITREKYTSIPIVVTRAKDETPYQTWKKVEQAAGLEENELVAQLNISANQHTAIYPINKMSLNHYGEVRVRFEY